MIIAQQKRKENISEYVLYMWQLEDMIRACNFDIDLLMKGFSLPEDKMQSAKQWYQNMADAMIADGIKEKGHLMQLKEIVQDLSSLNIALLKNEEDKKYRELFTDAMPFITDIINHSDGFVKNEIDACFTGLYGLMLLRLQKKGITEGTKNAMQTFSKLLAVLAVKYKQYESGDLKIEI